MAPADTKIIFEMVPVDTMASNYNINENPIVLTSDISFDNGHKNRTRSNIFSLLLAILVNVFPGHIISPALVTLAGVLHLPLSLKSYKK